MFDGIYWGDEPERKYTPEEVAKLEKAFRERPDQMLEALAKQIPIFDKGAELARVHAFIEREWQNFDQAQIEAARMGILTYVERKLIEGLLSRVPDYQYKPCGMFSAVNPPPAPGLPSMLILLAEFYKLIRADIARDKAKPTRPARRAGSRSTKTREAQP